MRQIVLDTETTGLEPDLGHRIIEIGAVEVVNRKLTGRHFHKYLNPQREVDDGAYEVHGLDAQFLSDKPLFGEVCDELLEFMSLAHKRDAHIRTLSGGMQRRLTFVRALLNDPEILILDEPTTGLDPAVRHTIWQKILDLKDSGKTILLTTHYLDEAERLCDDLVIMNEGKIQAQGQPNHLIQTHSPGYIATFRKTPTIRKFLMNISDRTSELMFIEESSALALRAPSLEKLISLITHDTIKPLLLRPCNLEDVFLSVTGRELTGNA